MRTRGTGTAVFDLEEALGEYREAYAEKYLGLMAKKFGFKGFIDGDKKFIDDTLELLEEKEIDFPIFFRELSGVTLDANIESTEIKKIGSEWIKRYFERLRADSSDEEIRKESMNSVNPKFVLRTHIAENAIREAVDNKEYSEIEKIRKILMKPFEEQPEYENYSYKPPEGAEVTALSCSS